MDFLALPRRDLQALCKRNDIRANMTNAAMADALRALPKVEGIEEYVKVLQPVAVPETAVESVNEEQKLKKPERPLPRGRRATAKSSEPIVPEEDTEKLEDAKRQSNKEDAQAPGVGRRGASRRARPVPAVPLPPGKAVAEEDGQEDNLKREAKRDNAPAPVLGRCGASRRGRPLPAVAAPAAESEVAGAEEEQIEEVVEEDLKREAIMDDAPALGVGRRGAKRRARPASSVAALSGKVVAEEQRPSIPRAPGVKAKGTSTEPITLDDSDDEEKEDAKPEEQEDAKILGVGRRGGASRCAQAAPAVAVPEAKTEEEQRAPVPRGRRVKAKTTEIIRMDDSKEEKKEDTKPEEEKGDAPAMERRGASRRTPAPSEAAVATRRSTAASKDEAGDVAVEDVPIRATRKRKPTLKAAAAAAAVEEKAPRRATRRGAVTSTVLQQQEVEEEAQEVVGAPDMVVEVVPIRATRQLKPTMKALAAAATAEGKAPPRATRRGAVMRTVLLPEVQEEPQGVFSDAEAVGEPISFHRCDALVEELAEASDPQKEELNEVDAPKQDEYQDVAITEDEKTPAKESSVTDQECTDNSEMQEQQGNNEKCHAHLATQEDEDQDFVIIEDEKLIEVTTAEEPSVTDQECTDNLEMQEQRVDNEKCHAPLATQEEEDQDVVVIEDEKLIEETPAEEPPVTDQECMDNSEMQEQQVDEKKCHAPLATQEDEDQDLGIIEDEKLMEETPAEEPSVTNQGCTDNSEMQEKQGDDEKSHALLATQEDQDQDVVITKDEELMEETPAEEPSVTDQECTNNSEMQEKKLDDEKCHAPLATQEVEDQDAVITEDEKLMEETPAEEPSVTDEEWTNNSDMQEQQVENENFHAPLTAQEESPILGLVSTVAEQASEDNQGASFDDDGGSSSGLLYKGVCEETYDSGEEMELVPSVQTLIVQADHVVVAENLPEQVIDCEIIVETTSMIVDEKQQSTVTMDEDAFKDHFETDSVHDDEQMEVAATDEVPELTETHEEMKTPMIVDEKQHSTATINGDIVDDHFKTHVAHFDEQNEVVATELPGVTAIDGEILKTPLIVDEKKQSTVTMDGDVVFDNLKTDIVHADEQKEVTFIVTDEVPDDADEQKEVTFIVTDEVPDEVTGTCEEVVKEKAVVITEDIPNKGTVLSITHTMDGCVRENYFGTDFCHDNEQKKAITGDFEPEVLRAQDGVAQNEIALLDDSTESVSKSIIAMGPSDEAVHEEKGVLITDEILQGTAGMHDMEDDQFETVFVQADQVATADNLPEQVNGCEITLEVNTPVIVDERQQSTVTIDENVIEDGSETYGVHFNEQIEVVTTDKVPELKLIEDVLVQADQVVTDDNLPEQVTDCEITVENTAVIVDEKQQSTVAMEADADEQMEVEVPELTGTNVEVIEKTPLGVDEKQKSSVTMDTDVIDDRFKTDDVHAYEQMEVELTETDEVVEEMKTPLGVDEKQKCPVTMDTDVEDDHFITDVVDADEQMEVELTEIDDEVIENALLDDVTESLSKSIITLEPSVSKKSSEKNPAEPMAVLEEKGVKVASETEDLTKLSLGQLKAKIKEKLNAKKNKEAKKRVALARVDENVCRSHAKGQQQNLNLQQH